MKIIDLPKEHLSGYFCCLEEWSEDMQEAGLHKKLWYEKNKERGLRVKLAMVDEKPVGMIQYLPVKESFIAGENLYLILCIWVHGYKKGVGNHQKRGIGSALLKAAEDDVRSRDQKGIAAWGLALPFWMRASWFKKHGYRPVDKMGMSVLLWKPFSEDANPPRWVRPAKQPEKDSDTVIISSFVNGWCPVQNLLHERALRAAHEFGDTVEFRTYPTTDKSVFHEWGISDGLYIDGKALRNGPPLSYRKIVCKIEKRLKRTKTTRKHR